MTKNNLTIWRDQSGLIHRAWIYHCILFCQGEWDEDDPENFVGLYTLN